MLTPRKRWFGQRQRSTFFLDPITASLVVRALNKRARFADTALG
jgi:hypothetical protein